MKLLTKESAYEKTIGLAQDVRGTYDKQVTFHAYWVGTLNEKHLYSIMSCKHHHPKDDVILWVHPGTEVPEEFHTYAKVKEFDYVRETQGTLLEGHIYRHVPSFFSDVVRYLLLYKYGGCWFDLDVFFLRSMEPIFATYAEDVVVYQWADDVHPNGAVFVSLVPESSKMRRNIEYILAKGMGWGFQQARLTYDTEEMDMFVLPNSWFDAGWIANPYGVTWDNWFENTEQTYDTHTYLPGAFAYHWHNRWDRTIEPRSPFAQLVARFDQKTPPVVEH